MTTQLDLLDAVAGNPLADGYRRRIRNAIKADAAIHGGEVDSNRVRAALTGAHGLEVDPRMLSATYGALRATGVLEFAGWTTNTDTAGRNSGKPARLWRLVGEL